MGEQTTQHRQAERSGEAPPGRAAPGPRHAALTQLSESLNQAPAAGRIRQFAAARANRTGLPDTLKHGIEALSGQSMDHVKVHYNSSKPAQLNAHAYAQGSDIHLAPGRQQHLPHEAWHVVQQAQGRVKPTLQMKAGVAVNDDAGLEHEATAMGAKAASHVGGAGGVTVGTTSSRFTSSWTQPAQLWWPGWKKGAASTAAVAGAAGLAAGAAGLIASPALLTASAIAAAGGLGYHAYRYFHGDTAGDRTRRPSTAEDRMRRASARGAKRATEGRTTGAGRYQTTSGPVTVSPGHHGQLMTQSRKGDYNDETFGSYPAYNAVRAQLPSVTPLYDPDATAPPTATPRQELATSLARTMGNVSEEQRAPGYGKYSRALARHHDRNPTAPHPLDPTVNVAITSAQSARDLMGGRTPLTRDMRSAVDDGMSDSSDEEDGAFPARSGMHQSI